MIVSFWSPVKNEYVSSITALTAMAGCSDFLCKVVLAENYVGADNIGHCLFGDTFNRLRREYDRYQSEYFEHGDSFLKFLKKETGKQIYRGRALEVMQEHLYFMPMNQSLRADIYEYGFDAEFEDIRDFCEAGFDYLFLNTASSGNLSTKAILNCSDQVVICLPTAEWILDVVMERYSSLLSKSVILFHGDVDSNYLRRMRRKYPALRERMYYLPVTEEMKEAIREGHIIDFGYRLRRKNRKEKADPVMQKISYLAFSVMRKEKHNLRLKYEEMRELFTIRNTEVAVGSFVAEQPCVADASFDAGQAFMAGTTQLFQQQSL